MDEIDGSFANMLEEAIMNERLDQLAWLLPLININDRFENLNVATPLQFAIYLKKRRVVEVLLQAGASLAVRMSNGQSPLHSVILDDSHIAECLVQADVDIDAQDSSGRTALYIAAHQGLNSAVCMLLYYGADPNIPDYYGRTPFMRSLTNSDSRISKTLLDYVDDLNVKCNAGLSALQQAIYKNNAISLDIVESGCEICLSNSERYDLLHMALRNSNPLVFRKVFPQVHYDPSCCKNFFRYFLGWGYNSCIWEECLMVILNSQYAPQFIDDETNCIWKEGVISLCSEIVFQLECYEIEMQKRLKIIEKMLNFGLRIYQWDFVVVYRCFGFNEEFKLLTKYPFSYDYKYFSSFPGNTRCYVLVCLMTDLKSLSAINATIEDHCRLILDGNDLIDHKLCWLLDIAPFFTLKPYYLKLNRRNISERLIPYFNLMRTVPNLLELSRNRFLAHLASKPISVASFHNFLENLPISEVYYKILTYNRGIY